MTSEQNRSWWKRQSLLAKIFWIFVVLVVLALLLNIHTYWDWAFHR